MQLRPYPIQNTKYILSVTCSRSPGKMTILMLYHICGSRRSCYMRRVKWPLCKKASPCGEFNLTDFRNWVAWDAAVTFEKVQGLKCLIKFHGLSHGLSHIS